MAIGRRRGGKSAGKCLKERCMDRPGVVKQRHRSERKRRECGCSIFSAPTVVFAVLSTFCPRVFIILEILHAHIYIYIYPTPFSTRSKNTRCELTSVLFFFSLREDTTTIGRLLFPFRNGIRQSYLYVCVSFRIKRKNFLHSDPSIYRIHISILIYTYINADSIKSRSRI